MISKRVITKTVVRERKRAVGTRTLTFTLSPKAHSALTLLKQCSPGKSDRQLIEWCILSTYEAVAER